MNNESDSPPKSRYECRKLDIPLDIPQALRLFPTVPLAQAWLTEPEERFAPAVVAAAWSDECLHIYARLEDEDIFNPVHGLNHPAFLQGDIFEILLRPCDEETYFEFHVTPHGQTLQLRYPSPQIIEEFRVTGDLDKLLASYCIPQPVVKSRTEIFPTEGYWTVQATIPFSTLLNGRFPQEGDNFIFSFSRYDYTREEAQPVLSSSSAHPLCDFHRQAEWRRMILS